MSQGSLKTNTAGLTSLINSELREKALFWSLIQQLSSIQGALMQLTSACVTHMDHLCDTRASTASNTTRISIAEKLWLRDDGKTKQNELQASVPHSVSSLSMKLYQIIWKLFKYGLEQQKGQLHFKANVDYYFPQVSTLNALKPWKSLSKM